jgi:multicomponent Na+:H+ antiporter subunit B
MGIEIIMAVIIGFILLGAVIAVEIKNLLSAVIALGTVGIGVSIAFLFLMAPDLAIVQIAVEALLLIFLIRATLKPDIRATHAHIHPVGLGLVVLLCLGLIVFGFFAFQRLEFGNPVMAQKVEAPSNHYLREGLRETGAPNIVTAVILDYRGYDTLGEATVIFTAVVGALVVLRAKARRKKGGTK